MLNKQQILELRDLTTEKVYVKEWKEYVFVRSLTGEERDRFEQSNLVKEGKTLEVKLFNVRAKLVALALCDEQGNSIMDESDAAWLGGKSAGAISTLYDAAARLSGITKEDIDEIVKN